MPLTLRELVLHAKESKENDVTGLLMTEEQFWNQATPVRLDYRRGRGTLLGDQLVGWTLMPQFQTEVEAGQPYGQLNISFDLLEVVVNANTRTPLRTSFSLTYKRAFTGSRRVVNVRRLVAFGQFVMNGRDVIQLSGDGTDRNRYLLTLVKAKGGK